MDREGPHRSWPRSVAARSLGQFDGIYANYSLDAETGRAVEKGHELFPRVGGESQSIGDPGQRVELRASPDERSLRARLLDRRGRQIGAVTWQRGEDFEFSRGKLIESGPSSGWEGESSNFGPAVTLTRDTLRLSSTGGLLGTETENGTGLLMVFFPVAWTTKQSLYWPRLDQADARQVSLGRGSAPADGGPPKLTENEAISIAAGAASKAGYDLRKYAGPEASYSRAGKEDSWFIHYSGKVPRPGHHFSVRVNDKTRRAQLFGGR